MKENTTMETTNRHSPTLGALAKALAAAQAEMKDATKDATNPHFNNKYATLSSVRAAVTPALAKHGLALTQLHEPHGAEGVCIITMLIHESGEWISSSLFVPVSKKDAQGFGSAISYARRYATASIVGVATDDDDDANEAVKPGKPQAAPAAVTGTVNADVYVKAFESAQSTDEMAKIVLAVGNVKDKLTPNDRERIRAAHDATLRRLEQAA